MPSEDLGVTVVEVDEAGGTVEVLARCTLIPVARGAFREAVKLRPLSFLLLKDGIRVIETHNPNPK